MITSLFKITLIHIALAWYWKFSVRNTM